MNKPSSIPNELQKAVSETCFPASPKESKGGKEVLDCNANFFTIIRVSLLKTQLLEIFGFAMWYMRYSQVPILTSA